jgi:hypothetical protein
MSATIDRRRQRVKRLGVLGLVLSLAVLGCENTSTGDSADTQTSCNAWCTAVIAAACATPPGMYTDVSTCKTQECEPLRGASASCQTALKKYYDCERAQSDICADSGCTNEFAALDHC